MGQPRVADGVCPQEARRASQTCLDDDCRHRTERAVAEHRRRWLESGELPEVPAPQEDGEAFTTRRRDPPPPAQEPGELGDVDQNFGQLSELARANTLRDDEFDHFSD
eukprot:Hpha_TRINITY_DN9157_c0_g1::TRINITY_DN9157_c0_g1_i1::g.94502::m.94502